MDSRQDLKVEDGWVREEFSGFYQASYKLKKPLFSGKSDFQQIDVVETEGFGKMLFNDGLAMISERDEFVYHDMISHVPLFVHPNPKRVLVIGGGDGGTVREVIRHKSVEHCHLVEIDPLVVEGCRKHIPQTSAALDDERVTVLVEDGVQFIKNTELKFDVIIVDSTDPIGPATPLFGVEFYQDVFSALNDKGIVVSQCESAFFCPDEQSSLLKVLGQVFPSVNIYNYSNLTYPGGLWSFSFASKGLCPVGDFDEKRVEESGLDFEWYNSGIHKSSFCLPQFQKKNLNSLVKKIPGFQ